MKSSDNPNCPHCQTNAFIRVEQVISGRRITRAYYCGRCEQEWRIEATHTPERRQGERRKRRVDEEIKKTPARASLRAKRDRRNVI